MNTIILPENFEIEKVEGNKIYLKDSNNLQFPKSWRECVCRVKNPEYINSISRITKDEHQRAERDCYNMLPSGYGEKVLALCQLLICRDIYREIEKSEINQKDSSKKFVIRRTNNTIQKTTYYSANCILSFETEKARNAFYENFLPLIKLAGDLI